MQIDLMDMDPTTLLTLMADCDLPKETKEAVWKVLCSIVGERVANEMLLVIPDLQSFFGQMWKRIN